MQVQQFKVGMMDVFCYIVSCKKTGKAVIIDPGGDEDTILNACKDGNLEVKYIINTHGHPDHVCGNKKIKEATGAPIIMHRDDVVFFWQPEVKEYFSMLGLPESPTPDILAKDCDTFFFGEEEVQVLHTPGHTPGGICLYNEPHCFTGDTLFAEGVGRTDFPGGSSDELMVSIRSRLLVLPPETVVWPGHGYGGNQSSIGREAKTNPFIRGSY